MSEWMRRMVTAAVVTAVTILAATGALEGQDPRGEDTRQPIVLAAAIQAGIGRDTLFARLGGLTSKCVSCHASYRATTEEEGS